jgi:recombinational DNA repair ATPase RecF
VLALDDILSELDPERRRLVLESMADYEQVLLSTAEPDAVPQEFMEKADLYTVHGGKVIAGETAAGEKFPSPSGRGSG